ncbi:hypothetical protein FoTM2_010901, partial [Fusarium oxysporum f. sp. vasinfectum]
GPFGNPKRYPTSNRRVAYGVDGGLDIKFWHVPREMNRDAESRF